MSRLIIKASPLVDALLNEMNAALTAMENGHYDKAFSILEDRCRPADPLETPPAELPLQVNKVARDVLKAAPANLITQISEGPVEVLAYQLAREISKDRSEEEAKLIVAIAAAANFGISVEVVIEGNS